MDSSMKREYSFDVDDSHGVPLVDPPSSPPPQALSPAAQQVPGDVTARSTRPQEAPATAPTAPAAATVTFSDVGPGRDRALSSSGSLTKMDDKTIEHNNNNSSTASALGSAASTPRQSAGATNAPWTFGKERLLKSWAQQSLGYAWMHERSSKSYSKWNTCLSIPAVILTSGVGVSVLGSNDTSITSKLVQATVSLITGGIISLQAYLKYEKQAEKHEQMYRNFVAFHSDIVTELALPRTERHSSILYINDLKKKWKELINRAPTIPSSIIDEYARIVKKMSDVSRPFLANPTENAYIINIEDLSNAVTGSIHHAPVFSQPQRASDDNDFQQLQQANIVPVTSPNIGDSIADAYFNQAPLQEDEEDDEPSTELIQETEAMLNNESASLAERSQAFEKAITLLRQSRARGANSTKPKSSRIAGLQRRIEQQRARSAVSGTNERSFPLQVVPRQPKQVLSSKGFEAAAPGIRDRLPFHLPDLKLENILRTVNGTSVEVVTSETLERPFGTTQSPSQSSDDNAGMDDANGDRQSSRAMSRTIEDDVAPRQLVRTRSFPASKMITR